MRFRIYFRTAGAFHGKVLENVEYRFNLALGDQVDFEKVHLAEKNPKLKKVERI